MHQRCLAGKTAAVTPLYRKNSRVNDVEPKKKIDFNGV